MKAMWTKNIFMQEKKKKKKKKPITSHRREYSVL
jgi:hypothetical protein